jgi:hypothetical protein
VKGSHKWTKYKEKFDFGTFHAPKADYRTSLEMAAAAEGISPKQLESLIVKVSQFKSVIEFVTILIEIIPILKTK